MVKNNQQDSDCAKTLDVGSEFPVAGRSASFIPRFKESSFLY